MEGIIRCSISFFNQLFIPYDFKGRIHGSWLGVYFHFCDNDCSMPW